MKITISILVLGFLCIGIAGYVYALIENGDFSDITLKGNFPLSRVAFLKLGKGGLHKDPSINRVESWGRFY